MRFSISKRLRDLFPSSSKITLRLDYVSAIVKTGCSVRHAESEGTDGNSRSKSEGTASRRIAVRDVLPHKSS